MKQVKTFVFVAALFVLMSGNVFALNHPAVSQHHGTIYGMVVSDHGLMLGGEFGLTSQLALIANIGGSIDRLGIKYETSPNLAVTGGLMGSSAFIGLNGAFGLDRNVQGLYEVALVAGNYDVGLYYEFGVKVNLDSHLDIRGGLIGTVFNSHHPHLQLGLGYRF
jgi:hypothetical protein